MKTSQLMKRWSVAVAMTVLTATTAWAVPLPQLVVDKTQTSVSGISAGGYMAVQLHMAYSATFKKGAGVVAGGPYYCAEGSVSNATGRCMAHSTSIPVSSLVTTTNNWASSGAIDPTSNLSSSKVFLYSGSLDSVVKTAVMDDLKTYYQSYVPAANVVYKKDIASEHAMVTDDYGSGCSVKGAPYINDCNYDLAGEMLKHIYGPLNPRNNATLSGTFTEFDQTAFVSGHGMAATGWVYAPQACTSGTQCKVHVVLHGCKQNTVDVGQQYVRNTGYNRWADTNNVIMLYPQTGAAATNSCWDWWGYDSANYAKKSGPQMLAIKAMVDQLSSGSAPSNLPPPNGVATSGATTNSMVITWTTVNGAAGYNVYRNASKVNALANTASSFTDTNLTPGTSYTWTVKSVDSSGAESVASPAAQGTTTGVSAVCFTSDNVSHVLAGRAYVYFGFDYAFGSNQGMGLYNVFVNTTLKRTAPGYYVVGTCP
jgi:poly(3-hydroxybutyrate) depolymerase